VVDQAPAQKIQAALAGFDIITDHREGMRRRAVPDRRKVWGRPMSTGLRIRV
jgi:hypothetical protein